VLAQELHLQRCFDTSVWKNVNHQLEVHKTMCPPHMGPQLISSIESSSEQSFCRLEAPTTLRTVRSGVQPTLNGVLTYGAVDGADVAVVGVRVVPADHGHVHLADPRQRGYTTSVQHAAVGGVNHTAYEYVAVGDSYHALDPHTYSSST
jgi:hypothetical protein